MADRLLPGEFLQASGEERITSTNGLYTTVMQSDGNLVIYHTPTWRVLGTTDLFNQPVSHAVMQADGNFVIYSPSGRPLWATDTWRYPGAYLVMQNDGNLVLYEPGRRAVWASNTWDPPGGGKGPSKLLEPYHAEGNSEMM